MKRLLMCALAAVSGLILVQCGKNEKKEVIPGRVVITGEVVNYNKDIPTLAGVMFNDILDVRTQNQVMDLPRDGKFRFERDMFYGRNLRFQLDNRYLDFYANPGDSIHLVVDGQAFYEGEDNSVEFSGTNAGMQREFQDMARYTEDMYVEVKDIISLQPKEFMERFGERYKVFADSIDNYARINGISDKMRDMAKKGVLYSSSGQLWNYQREDPEASIKMRRDSLFDVNKESNFENSMFMYHLMNIAYAMVFPDEQYQEYVDAGDSKGAMIRAIEILSELPANMTRDAIMYDYLYNYIMVDKGNYKFIENPGSLFSKPYFAVKLKEIADRVETIPLITLSGVSSLGENDKVVDLEPLDFIAYIKDKYKGKVIYMDIYATWCGPCRMEFVHAGKMHSQYAGKDVAFVFVCMDSPKDQWLSTINEFNLEGDHYFFNGQSSREFLGKSGIRGYPTYLLFDRKGDLVTMSPSRPSRIVEGDDTIDKLL